MRGADARPKGRPCRLAHADELCHSPRLGNLFSKYAELTMPRVRFHPNQKEVEVAAGESLLRAAILAGVHVNATCGGSGVCGKCRVVVESGSVASEPSAKLTAEQVASGHVLACTSTVTGDVEVRVPVESQMGDTRAVLAREHRVRIRAGGADARPKGRPSCLAHANERNRNA